MNQAPQSTDIMNTDPRVDRYIAARAPFARPILTHLRRLVHQACPGVQETIKWSMPAFEHQGLICLMAGFKAHTTLTLWKGALILGREFEDGAMGQFGRITSLDDLPPEKVLLGYFQKAVELNEAGVKKTPSKPATARRSAAPVMVPAELHAALAGNEAALARFEAFSPSHQKEYAEWVAEAKRPETRARRVAKAVEQIADGKGRHWQYERC